MTISIPRITKPVALKDYAEAMGEGVVQVWVNAPYAFYQQHDELVTRLNQNPGTATPDFYRWWSELWSQGADESSRISPEAATRMAVELFDTDPRFFGWLCRRSWDEIRAHKGWEKKD